MEVDKPGLAYIWRMEEGVDKRGLAYIQGK